MSNEMKNNAGLLNHFQTKERSANFSKGEIDRLRSLIEKYKDVLLCKKTDGTSTKQKEHVWSCIASEFNAVGETPRTTKQLKYKFENIKRTVKKEASMERQHMYKTGGGRLTLPSPPSPGSEDTTNWLKSIMSTSIDGLEAVYDDDVILKEPSKEDASNNTLTGPNLNEIHPITETVEIVPIQGDKGASSPSRNWVFDTSTPHSSLKRPVSSPLKRLTKKRRLDEENVRQALHKKK